MPYRWITSPNDCPQTLRLWPYNALPPRGMAAFVLASFAMILIPCIALLGSVLLWGVLPFLLLAIWGIYFALRKNYQARQITEILTLDAQDAHLVRYEPSGETQKWVCNRYWAKVTKYDNEGPIPHYVTLQGKGREVEIGAFLSEKERIALYGELKRAWSRS